jgi:hypothetical protein
MSGLAVEHFAGPERFCVAHSAKRGIRSNLDNSSRGRRLGCLRRGSTGRRAPHADSISGSARKIRERVWNSAATRSRDGSRLRWRTCDPSGVSGDRNLQHRCRLRRRGSRRIVAQTGRRTPKTARRRKLTQFSSFHRARRLAFLSLGPRLSYRFRSRSRIATDSLDTYFGGWGCPRGARRLGSRVRGSALGE